MTIDDVNMFQLGYNKAIDDFVKFASTMPTVKIEDGKIRPMWLKEMAEYLKEGEEYNGGWIACNERLPEDDSICIVTVEYPNNETIVDYGWFDRNSICWFVGMQEFKTSNILAWQPLPKPFDKQII